MVRVVRTVGRSLPAGWRDLGRQLAIWFGFLAVYQVVRGLSAGDRAVAITHGAWVIHTEKRLGHLFELTIQAFAATSEALELTVSWTYWLSEFAVLGGALLWVYLRRNADFYRFRNWALLAAALSLVGYLAYPTAPPRMFGGAGFVDTLAKYASLNHGSGVVEFASNQYAAMPSLHVADALIVGITLAVITRRRWAKALWLLWPAWVCFSVVATGNHFWLDCAAGALVTLITGIIVHRHAVRRCFRG